MIGWKVTKGRLALVGGLAGLAIAAVHPAGCGGTAVMDHDDGGAGGGTATGTGTGAPTGSPTGSPTGTGDGAPTGSPTGTGDGAPTGSPTGTGDGMPTGTPTGSTCDYTGDCEACQYCSMEGPCISVLGVCQNSQQCIDFADCFDQCTQMDPPPECWNECEQQYPSGASQYWALAVCVLCDQCLSDCQASGTFYCP